MTSVTWTVTCDCADARAQAAFWKLALGYEDAAPPDGWATWDQWFEHFEVPDDERNDGAVIEDPDGVRPRIGFLRVPEGKTAKNRLHLDLEVAGGRRQPQSVRAARIEDKVQQLVAAGATIVRREVLAGALDHYGPARATSECGQFCTTRPACRSKSARTRHRNRPRQHHRPAREPSRPAIGEPAIPCDVPDPTTNDEKG